MLSQSELETASHVFINWKHWAAGGKDSCWAVPLLLHPEGAVVALHVAAKSFLGPAWVPLAGTGSLTQQAKSSRLWWQ